MVMVDEINQNPDCRLGSRKADCLAKRASACKESSDSLIAPEVEFVLLDVWQEEMMEKLKLTVVARGSTQKPSQCFDITFVDHPL